jgi:hypothetical protein
VIYSTGKSVEKPNKMRRISNELIVAALLVFFALPAAAQNDTLKTASEIVDSLKRTGLIYSDLHRRPEISLSTDQAIQFLEKRLQPHYWNNVQDPFRKALSQLVFQASNPPYDSSEVFLKKFPFDSVKVSWDKFYIWDPVRFKIPELSPVQFTAPPDSAKAIDTTFAALLSDSSVARIGTIRDSLVSSADEIAATKDTSILVIIDTLNQVTSSNPDFPFKYYEYPYQGDSIEVAVNSLLKYMEERDSSIINFTGRSNAITPFWINSHKDYMARFWLNNEFNDSVTVWIGDAGRNTVGLYLEQGVNFKRPPKQETGNTEARINVEKQDKSKLLELQRVVVKQQLWKYRTEANLAFSQTSLFNWVKGGEKSLSSLLDVTGYADYNNKQQKISSSNFARIKLGFLATGDNPIRKNTDIIETNSKVNHKAFGKFDFSAIMLFKTQLLKGYNYPNDSVPVSKYFNPAILTLGFGLDYKPNAQTSINFSPLSYKGTYMTDTTNIDQTKYGIPNNKKSLHEPGVSLNVMHNWKPLKTVGVTNRVSLFTNYVNNPQNVDIDWEMILTANLNWFTDLRINTHFIFDDDTKTPVLDDNNKPVLRPDGSVKKTARVQFKEMIGVSLAFRF